MAGIHELLGGIVVLAFIVTALLAAVQASGRDFAATRYVAYAAAALLLLQYLLGIELLAGGTQNTSAHYIIALLVLVPVALQHGGGRRLSPQTRGVATLIWSLAAAFLTVIAYLTGTHRIG